MTKVIDLGMYRTAEVRVFAGRDRGAKVREAAGLDTLDKDAEEVEVRVPKDVFSVNSSFFLGMFTDSIKGLKEAAFRTHYKFTGKDISRVIDECIDEALRTGSPLPGRSE
jgi:hypothetical protein